MVGFIRRAFDFVRQPTNSRTIGILLFFLLVSVVSFTVYVAQQQQTIKQRASGAPAVCAEIDDIQTCSTSSPGNNPCSVEGAVCKIGDKIYECKK